MADLLPSLGSVKVKTRLISIESQPKKVVLLWLWWLLFVLLFLLLLFLLFVLLLLLLVPETLLYSSVKIGSVIAFMLVLLALGYGPNWLSDS